MLNSFKRRILIPYVIETLQVGCFFSNIAQKLPLKDCLMYNIYAKTINKLLECFLYSFKVKVS